MGLLIVNFCSLYLQVMGMGASLSIDPNVHVVVVGGGFGGIAAAQQLKSSGISFTLIDLRDAFHHNPAALRASVQSGKHFRSPRSDFIAKKKNC